MLVIGDLTFVTSIRRHDPDVTGHAGIGVVVDDALAVRMPHVHPPGLSGRRGPPVHSAALGELLGLTPFGGDAEDVVLVIEVLRERDYDQKINRPRFRLMNEAYKLSELYLRLADVLVDRDVEVHLDINPNEMHGSNCVMNEAIGYIRGTCNVIPMIKPKAFAASYAADRFKELKIA